MALVSRVLKIGSLLIMLAMLTMGCAYHSEGDRAMFGGREFIASDEVVQGDMAVFGGDLEVEEGARITGDMAVFGGTVYLDGVVEGDMVNFGGTVTDGPNAEVLGEVAILGGSHHRGEGIPEAPEAPETPEAPEAPEAPEMPAVPAELDAGRPGFGGWVLGVVGGVVQTVLKAIAFGVLGLALALFLPDHLRRVGDAASTAPAASIGVGCLTLPVVGIVAAVLVITIIGIPVSLLLGAATAAAWIFGWIGLGMVFGDRLLRSADVRNPRLAAAAAIGSGALVLASSLIEVIPVIGWFLPPMLAMWAIGATVLTRGGTQSYPVQPRLQPVPAAGYPPIPPTAATGSTMPPAQQRSASGNLFADLAADLGIEDELYGDDDLDDSGPETPVSPPDGK